MEIGFKIIFVILLILLNGYFVASEYALVAIRKTRVDELARKGNKRARLIQAALENITQYIFLNPNWGYICKPCARMDWGTTSGQTS